MDMARPASSTTDASSVADLGRPFLDVLAWGAYQFGNISRSFSIGLFAMGIKSYLP